MIYKVYDFMKKQASDNYAKKLTDTRTILSDRMVHSMKQAIVTTTELNITKETGAMVCIFPSTTEPTTKADIE